MAAGEPRNPPSANCADWILSAVAAEGTDHAFMVPGGLDDTFMP